LPQLTVVVPAYNESAVLRTFHQRLQQVLAGLPLDSGVLYVDDGSRDDSWQVIQSLVALGRTSAPSSFRATSARRPHSPPVWTTWQRARRW
jgi:glycosyltransferase involved in cell wall biosynthesis